MNGHNPDKVFLKNMDENFKLNLLVVYEGVNGVELHYNINSIPENGTYILIDLGVKDVDYVAEQCRMRLKDQGMEDLKTVLDMIETIKEEK